MTGADVMKRILFVLAILLTYLVPNYPSVGACNYTVSIAKSDGTFENVENACFTDFSPAVNRMFELTSNEQNTPVVKDSGGKIVDMRGGIVDSSVVLGSNVIYLYPSSSSTTAQGYTNGASAGEMGYISSSIYPGGNGRIKVMISGQVAWVKETIGGDTMQLIPTSQIKNKPYYKATVFEDHRQLEHHYTNGGGFLVNNPTVIGVAPEFMETGKAYYSWDGNYFYQSFARLAHNLRNGKTGGEVNPDDPFYNYYQYLPVRSMTNYTAFELNKYFDMVKIPLEKEYTVSEGELYVSDGVIMEAVADTNLTIKNPMYKSGSSFIAAQDENGVNALTEFAWAIHESAFGTSRIAGLKNNLFGIGAYDGNPYSGSTPFYNVLQGINMHSKTYISSGYTDALSDSRYYGSHLGNKASGFNVKYASDPYWGEKIAGRMYRIDRALGMKDYNYYTVGIKEDASILNMRYETNTLLPYAYQTKNGVNSDTITHYPFLVTGETNGEVTGDDSVWYEVMSDMPKKDTDDEKCQFSYFSTTSGTFEIKDRSNEIETGAVGAACDYSWADKLFAARGIGVINRLTKLTYNDPEDVDLYETKLYGVRFDGDKLILNGRFIADGFEMSSTTSHSIRIVVKNKKGNVVQQYPAPVNNSHGLISDGVDYSYSSYRAVLNNLAALPLGDYSIWLRASDSDGYVIEEHNILDPTFKAAISPMITDQTEYVVTNTQNGLFLSTNEYADGYEVKSFVSKFDWVDDKLYLKGGAIIKGKDHDETTKHTLVLTNITTDKKVEIPLTTTQGDYLINLGDDVDYTYAWFEDSIDLGTLVDAGSYSLSIKVSAGNISKNTLFVNYYRGFIPGYVETATKSIYFSKDRYNRLNYVVDVAKGSLNIDVDERLSDREPFLYLDKLSVVGNYLEIYGSAFVRQVNYPLSEKVTYKLIMMNQKGQRFEDVLVHAEALWNNTKIVNDTYNYDNTWFMDSVDLSDLPSGEYDLYLYVSSRNYNTVIRLNSVYSANKSQSSGIYELIQESDTRKILSLIKK